MRQLPLKPEQMMVPIGMALIAQLESGEGRRLEHFGAALMLGIAYGANIGEIGTKHMFSSEQPPWTPVLLADLRCC